MVWSYITSQAYHEEHGNSLNYQAVLFDEGQPFQIEGAAIVKGALRSDSQIKLAHQFLEFLISPEVQVLIPRKVWMYPALSDVQVPDSFKRLPKPQKWISSHLKGKEIEATLKKWNEAVSGKAK